MKANEHLAQVGYPPEYNRAKAEEAMRVHALAFVDWLSRENWREYDSPETFINTETRRIESIETLYHKFNMS